MTSTMLRKFKSVDAFRQALILEELASKLSHDDYHMMLSGGRSLALNTDHRDFDFKEKEEVLGLKNFTKSARNSIQALQKVDGDNYPECSSSMLDLDLGSCGTQSSLSLTPRPLAKINVLSNNVQEQVAWKSLMQVNFQISLGGTLVLVLTREDVSIPNDECWSATFRWFAMATTNAQNNSANTGHSSCEDKAIVEYEGGSNVKKSVSFKMESPEEDAPTRSVCPPGEQECSTRIGIEQVHEHDETRGKPGGEVDHSQQGTPTMPPEKEEQLNML
nr:phosphatidylinositol/phosphatidylcholine transfer protein SFH12-like isoform X1 [Ipomoea batatas]